MFLYFGTFQKPLHKFLTAYVQYKQANISYKLVIPYMQFDQTNISYKLLNPYI